MKALKSLVSFKLLLVLGLTSLMTTGAWASGQSAPSVAATTVNINLINKELANLLQKYNNKTTKMSATLDGATVDANRATGLAVTVKVQKNGAIPAALTANINYSYPESKLNPLLGFGANLATPNGGLRKILVNLGMQPQKIDAFMKQLPAILQQQILYMLSHQYGDAVAVSAHAEGVQKDKANHYVAENIVMRVTTNPAQLPPELGADQLALTSANLNLYVNLKNGAKVSGVVVLNPKFIDFQPNRLGLKQYIEELEKNDPQALDTIKTYVQEADDFLDAALHPNNGY